MTILFILFVIEIFRISKFFVKHLETKIRDSKIIFVEWRFDIIVTSFSNSNAYKLEIIYTVGVVI